MISDLDLDLLVILSMTNYDDFKEMCLATCAKAVLAPF